MAINPAAPLDMSIGMANGLTRRGPSWSTVSTADCRLSNPPIADDTITPTRPDSDSATSNPACSMASLAAAAASCSKRSRRLASLACIYTSGWKFFTSQAIFTSIFLGSNRVIGPTPETPLTAFSQDSRTDNPNGLTVPIPVMTTFSCMLCSSGNLQVVLKPGSGQHRHDRIWEAAVQLSQTCPNHRRSWLNIKPSVS